MLLNKRNILIFILINFVIQNLYSESFENIWLDMQNKYDMMSKKFTDIPVRKFYALYYYETLVRCIQNLIKGKPDINFLKNYELAGTMLRQNFDKEQVFEECFLRYCLTDKVRTKIENFKDNDKNLLPKPSIFGSVSTLGHLFYASKIMENLKDDPKILVEFGGGYGNFARIFKNFYPDLTIVIFDIPEVIALQYLFLSYIIPGEDIVIHDGPVNMELIKNKNNINLVPVFFLEKSNIKADIFVSTFALSETPDYVRDLVINKNFFNADLTYITGQINGWKETGWYNWSVDHNAILKSLRLNYNMVNCVPFHIFSQNLLSYEALAIK